MDQAKISVLIVTYKQEKYIGRNIESILQQKEYGLHEIVICDDNSPDKNWEVISEYVNKYPSIIRAYHNEKNLGIYGNSNKLARLCGDADLFCWLEGDDALCDGFFKSAQEFVQNNDIDIRKPIGILSDYYAIDKNGNKSRCRNYNVSKYDNPYGLFLRGRATWRASLFSASVIKQFTPIECNQGLSLAETLFDSQWFKYSEKCYYNPIVGSVYYTGLGVSVNWNLSSHFSAYHTTDYIRKWEYMIENGWLIEQDDVFLGRSKIAYTKCLIKFSFKELYTFWRDYIKGTKQYGIPVKGLLRQTARLIVLSLFGKKNIENYYSIMGYKIPLFNLNFDEREAQAAYDTIKSGWISTGPKNAELEQMFIDMWKVKYAVSMSNCTDALHVCCMVCGFGPGDEVICPSLTFAASCNCIRYVGATPVFADIVGPDHINIDPADIERKITPKTKGIVVVHMAGFPAKMDEIMAIARKHNLKVVEDACHGPLSEYKGKKLGTIGDCAAFSFFSNKNISTGEGGMFITNNEEMEKKARLIRSHGMSTMSYQRASGHATEYDITCLGYNFRMDDIRASIAIEQLKKLPGDLETRIKVRKQYVDRLSKIEGVAVPFADNTEFVSNYILPVVLLNSTKDRRNKIREYIHEAGIQTSVHYPAAHKFSTYRELGAVLPQTEYVTDNEITLPMYAALTEEQINFICDTFEKAVKEIK